MHFPRVSYRRDGRGVAAGAATRGSGRRPMRSMHAQIRAVDAPKTPAANPMVLGEKYCDATPAAAIETIMTLQRSDSMVEKTRPRYSSGVCRRSWELLRTLVTAMPTRDSIIH